MALACVRMVFSKRCYYVCFWQVINCGSSCGCSSRVFCAMKLRGGRWGDWCWLMVSYSSSTRGIIFYRHHYDVACVCVSIYVRIVCDRTHMKTILILQDEIIYKTFNWVDSNTYVRQVKGAVCGAVWKFVGWGGRRRWNPTNVLWIRTKSEFSSARGAS